MAAKSKNVHRTPRAIARSRRERIASVVLFLVLAGCVAVTVYAWWARSRGL